MRRNSILILGLLALTLSLVVPFGSTQLPPPPSPTPSPPSPPTTPPPLPSPSPIPAPSLTPITLVGASFAVPETLKDYVSSYRSSIPSDIVKMLPTGLPSEAFLLATNENLYLVFAEQSDKGLAEVEGWLLPTDIQIAGLNISVVVAKQVTFVKEGSPATLSEILANPEAYKFKLVKVNTYRRQVSILYDPDEPPYIELPVTIGYLFEKPAEQLAIVRKALEKAKEVILGIDKGAIEEIYEKIARDLLELEELQGLWVFNFEYEYWYDSRAVTNGIVIPLDHSIFVLLERSIPVLEKLLKALKADSLIIIYDVKTDLLHEDVQSVVELKRNSERYLGKIVKLTANCYGGYISVQEVIEHNTPCGEDYAYVPNVGCVNLVIDVRLEGFVAWNNVSMPLKRDELLLMVGVSSFHQDEQFVSTSGVFEVVGKVVSTKEISDSLPEDIALIIYGVRKVDEINFERLAAQVKDEIKSRVGELYWVLQNIYPYQRRPEIPFKVPSRVFRPKAPIFINTPRELPEIVVDMNFTVVINVADVPINLTIGNSTVSNIFIKLRETLENVTIYFEKLVEKPPEVPDPPGLVYTYHKIDVNVPEAFIEKASITFCVPKEWLASRGVTKDYVVMLRYRGGEWLGLLTSVVSENATHFEFVAETPGFSVFAVAVITPTTTISPEAETITITGTPGALATTTEASATATTTIITGITTEITMTSTTTTPFGTETTTTPGKPETTVVTETTKALPAVIWSAVAIALVALGLGTGLYIYKKKRV
ncbi:MAG: PGF-pre-PGF domain-containing protein [Thermosphaera sp.]